MMDQHSVQEHRLLTFLVSATITTFLVQPCNAQALSARMDQLVQSYADAGWFMGSVLVSKRGDHLLSKGYGQANLEWTIPNSPTTRFQLASITKQFTAASILLLEERGKLKTADSVRKYLPFAPAAWDGITVYDLLTHTSGISDDAVHYDPSRRNRLILRDEPTQFKPGEKWAYSNQGYIVLGYLLETISGYTYADFVHENIFRPLGMNDSGLDSNVAIIPRRASGYWPRLRGPENAERPNLALGFSAGSVYSTTQDLLRWEEGLFGGKVLTPASLHKMVTPYKADYGCGLYVKEEKGRLRIEHDGNNIGFNTQLTYFPEDKLVVIVLGNLNTGITKTMADSLAALVDGHGDVVWAPKAISLPPEILSRYVGMYGFPTSNLDVRLENNQLVAQFTGGTKFPIFAESATRFYTRKSDLAFEFLKTDTGASQSVTQYQNGKPLNGQRK
jgi:CubicO group peptidase (beta-lactamase class C family)